VNARFRLGRDSQGVESEGAYGCSWDWVRCRYLGALMLKGCLWVDCVDENE